MSNTTSKYEMDLTQGPILKNMIRFSIPLMFTAVLQLLYNAADMIVVGRFAGPLALAAVGSTGSITGLIVNLFLGLSVGANVLVAQYYGANLKNEVSRSVHTIVLLAFLGGVVLGILGIVLARPLLSWMDTPEDVINQAVLYMSIIFAGMPANLTYNFAAAILRAVGDTKRPLYFLSIAGAVNVVLNLVTVICFHWDVAGVASATVVSQIVSMILILRCLMRTEGCIHLDLKKLRLYKDKVIHIARVGLPAGIQSSMFAISNTLIQSSINSFGSIAMAGNTAAQNIESFIGTPLSAFQQATMSFTSQNFGARRFDRLGKIIICGALLIIVLGAAMGMLVYSFGEPLLGIYADDAAAIQYGMIRLTIMATTYFIGLLADVFTSALRGTGNSLFPMLMTILCICVFRIVYIYTVFAATPTLEVLYLSYPISWVLTDSVQLVTYLFHRKKLMRMFRQNEAFIV